MYYTLIICSSVNGHLSCLYFLAIVIKLCCHGHLYTRFCVNMFSVLFGVYLGVEMPGHVLTLTFRKLPDCFPKHLNHSVPTSSAWGLWFPPTLTVCLVYHSRPRVWVLPCGFCVSLMTTDVSIFPYSYWACVYLWGNVFANPLPNFILSYFS